MEKRLDKLEGLRGLAALYVVLHHTISHQLSFMGLNVGVFFRFGQEAVILFFLLSGFVISLSFEQARDKSLRTYFVKRATRIYIPLLLVFAFAWLLSSWRYNTWVSIEPINLLLNVFMLQDTNLKPNTIVAPYLGNTPLWSLSYEWWFYVIFAALQRFIPTTEKRSWCVFGVSVLAAILYMFWPTFIPRLLMYFSIWWAGVALSHVYISRDLPFREAFSKSLALPLCALFLVIIISAVNLAISSQATTIGVHPWLELRHHVFAMFAILLALFWHSQGWRFSNVLLRPFVVFAPVSYVLYISHIYFSPSWFGVELFSPIATWLLYFCLMLLFSYVVERMIYPRLQKRIYAYFL